MSPENRKSKNRDTIKGFKLSTLLKDRLERRKTPAPKARLNAVISRFERGWKKMGRGPRTMRRWGECNVAPDIFMYVAKDEASRRGFEVDTKKYQLKDLHEAAGGDPSLAFAHGFNTVTIDGQPFLVDLTFSQFLGPTGKLRSGPISVGPMYSSGMPNTDPLAKTIVAKGYVPLTDANLQHYLVLTSRAEDRSYVRNMNSELLASITPLPIDLSPSVGITPEFGLNT